MIERVVAALVLAACALLLLRLVVGERRRRRLDAAVRRTSSAAQGLISSLRHRRTASRVANDAIRRARGRGEWDGNVYKPKSFRKPPRDEMH